MKRTSQVLGVIGRISGIVLVVLGLLFWTGRAYPLVPLHMGLGVLLVLALWAQAALAARAGAPAALVAFAIGWGAVMPVFGMTQAGILPGPYHWIIRVLHLAIGIVGMRLVEVLGLRVRRAAVSRGRVGAPTRATS